MYKTGSTGRIVSSLFDYAQQMEDDPYIIYGIGSRTQDPHVFRNAPWGVRKLQSFRSRITGFPYGGCIWGTINTLRLIKRIKPDIVHLHCINGYMVNIYKLLTFLKENSIPTVITNHAEFMFTGGCTHSVDCEKWLTGCHECDKLNKEHPITYFFDNTSKEWNRLKKAYEGFQNLSICCVSDWARDRAARSPFFRNAPVKTVLNGIDTAVYYRRDATELRNRLMPEGNPIVIHVTANFYDCIKGGQHVIEMAKRMPEVNFIVIGSEAKEEMPKNCRFLGRVGDQNLLAQYYSMADVCLLTSVRETFSMVCAESLCCGTPVVGFMSGGPESIALTEFSSFVKQGDDDALEASLRSFLKLQVDRTVISENALRVYGKKTMCSAYYQIYQDLLQVQKALRIERE